MVDLELAKELEIESFKKDLENIENQYLNLIYNDLIDEVQERYEYEKMLPMMHWTCAICGCDILIDKYKNDVENFVCKKCSELYNNKNDIIDLRILKSTNRMYKFLEDKIYEELEDKL